VAFRRKCEADRGGDLTWHDGIGCSLDDRVSESLSLVFLCVCVSERERGCFDSIICGVRGLCEKFVVGCMGLPSHRLHVADLLTQ
jgi:hypothetical protein